MILNTGNKTDIPAFFSQWFFNRLHAGYVDVLNPYANGTKSYWRYEINPDVVDVITFCSKNPKSMLDNTKEMQNLLSTYKTMWYMTITPYGKDIEPNVPDLNEAVATFKILSNMVGIDAVGWRCDPILFGNGWNMTWHIKAFSDIAAALSGYTKRVVISFLNTYKKVSKNAPFASRPSDSVQSIMVKEFVHIASQYGMQLYVCHDTNPHFETFGANVTGCASIDVISEATGLTLKDKSKNKARSGCACVLNSDIGQYNTCLHGCAYCYANYDHNAAAEAYKLHDVNSSCLIGTVGPEDIVIPAHQESWKIS